MKRCLRDPVINPVIVDASRLEMSRHVSGRLEQRRNRLFCGVSDRVALVDQHRPVDLKMEVDEYPVTAISRP